MSLLLDSVTENTVGSGVAVYGPKMVTIDGDSVFGGASLSIEVFPTDESAKYTQVGLVGVLRGPDVIRLDGEGDYYARAVVRNAGPDTNITARITP